MVILWLWKLTSLPKKAFSYKFLLFCVYENVSDSHCRSQWNNAQRYTDGSIVVLG